MFSRRTSWELRPTRLAERLAAIRAAGDEVVDLTESNPTRCGFSYPAEVILGALADPKGLVYDPDPRGLLSARAAIASRHGEIDPSRIVLSSSTSEAYTWLFKLLCDAGDEVLVPAPSYPLLGDLAAIEAIRIVRYPLLYDGRWHLDTGEIERLAGPRTRAVIVVHPNNPTGSFLSHQEIEWLRGFAAGRGLAIVSDEVLAGYRFGEGEFPETLAGETESLTFSLGGLSKAAGLPQMKLSWIIASGPEPLREAALERLEVVGDAFLSVGTSVQVGLESLLSAGDSVRAEIVGRVRANRAALLQARDPGDAWENLHADGGWYAVLRVPRVMSDEEWALELLERERIHVHPGGLFDFPEEGRLVLSLLPPADRFREGIARLRACLCR
ncbi:MAG: pyridoxal phosphate-dependent aminotransferase [Candidatus Eisenbacteria bacterium]